MDSQKVYELVKSSPEIVGKHDKQDWIGLFAKTAIVQDPVGAGPNRKGQGVRNGRDELTRFYDIFIAPNDIKFTVHQDIIVDNEVVRDVNIRTVLSNGAISDVDALLKYSVIEEEGELKISHLNAYWDFTGNAKNLLASNGIKGVVASCLQFGNMIKVQGVPRVLEYCQAMYKGILEKGIHTVKSFEKALNDNDEDKFSRLFDSHAVIEFPAGKKVTAMDFFKEEGREMIIEFSKERSGGWFTSCVFDVRYKEEKNRGVVFFEFSPETKKIISARFFCNDNK